jgi:hypothetical protein
MQMSYPRSVRATLNFAADRSDGGEFSNGRPDRSRQKLLPNEVEIHNARLCSRRPTLDVEGLTLTDHPSGRAEWSNPKWIASEYVPSCVTLVKTLTGARQAFDVFSPLQRRADYSSAPGAAPTAGFVHIDQTRECGQQMIRDLYAKARGIEFKRAAIYNVWKPLTAPPQDRPLAISDRRSIATTDHIVGNTVEWLSKGEDQKLVSPYVILARSSQQPVWYYAPHMSVDESWVFIGVDLDPANPLGCAHSAFQHPETNGPMVPRVSIETRVLAIFE